jgi:hypothetical protein
VEVPSDQLNTIYNMMKKLFFIGIIFAHIVSLVKGQENPVNYGQIHGNFQIDMQSYKADSIIGAPDVPERILANAYTNLIYTREKFEAGIRYEAYLNALSGYDKRYNGKGIAYRYGKYKGDKIELTLGNFYEQFGNGLVFRTYEEKTLGIDNAMDGAEIKLKPLKGIILTGLIGKQKRFFDTGNGIVRGIDGDFNINEIFEPLAEKKTRLVLGGSFVSKYETSEDPVYNLPLNVAAYAARMTLSRSNFVFSVEYAEKMNDPSYDNGYIFKNGNAFFSNLSWSAKGFGVMLSAIRFDNMSFRSERSAIVNDLTINYLPSIAKAHTYAFAAMYPFSSQPMGQAGGNAEVFYKFQKNTLLGGAYGMDLSVNYTQVNSIQKEKVIINPNDEIPNLDGYKSAPFSIGDELYYKDFNVELQKKVNKTFKIALTYMHQEYNMDVIQGLSGHGIITSEIAISDLTVKFNSKNSLRVEIESLSTKQDLGNWAMLLLEYSYAPHWFIAAGDQYNYGNPEKQYQAHYYTVSAGYNDGGSRIQFGYGRQREGVVCVGGVCRNVPASNGFVLSVSSTF